jgi:hypothetical protein
LNSFFLSARAGDNDEIANTQAAATAVGRFRDFNIFPVPHQLDDHELAKGPELPATCGH